MGLFKDKKQRKAILKGILRTICKTGISVGKEALEAYPGGTLALNLIEEIKDSGRENNLAMFVAHSRDFIEVVGDALEDEKVDQKELKNIKELSLQLKEEIDAITRGQNR